jgi:hypothetical protein
MDSTSAEDRVRPVLIQHAHSCLASLQQTNEKPRSEAALRADGGWTVLVIAYPTANGEESNHTLTPCEADCLALLAQVERRLSGVRIHRELDRRNIGVYGLATVQPYLDGILSDRCLGYRPGIDTNEAVGPVCAGQGVAVAAVNRPMRHWR